MQDTAASGPYPNLTRPEDGYVFIITYGRSGSTVLQNVLNAVDGYCIRGENGNLAYHLCKLVAVTQDQQNMVRRRKTLAKPPADRPEDLRDILGTPQDPWYGAEAIDPQHVARQLFDGFVESCLNPPTGTRVAGFKEIRFGKDLEFFSRYLDILHETFPNARFMIHTRDLGAVLRSGWYRSQFAWKVKPRLKRLDQALTTYAEAHPDRCHVMRYDDYKGRPDAFAPLFQFLREPFDRDLVEQVLNRQLVHLQKKPEPALLLTLRKIFNIIPRHRNV